MRSLILKIGIPLILLYVVVIRNVYYVDPFYGCKISVVPGLEFNNAKVIEGLQLLKRTSIDDYKKICERVDKIDPNVGCGGFEGGCFYQTEPRTIYVTTANAGLEWVAGVLVHETCHATQFHEKRSMSETECHNEDDRILKMLVQY